MDLIQEQLLRVSTTFSPSLILCKNRLSESYVLLKNALFIFPKDGYYDQKLSPLRTTNKALCPFAVAPRACVPPRGLEAVVTFPGPSSGQALVGDASVRIQTTLARRAVPFPSLTGGLQALPSPTSTRTSAACVQAPQHPPHCAMLLRSASPQPSSWNWGACEHVALPQTCCVVKIMMTQQLTWRYQCRRQTHNIAVCQAIIGNIKTWNK